MDATVSAFFERMPRALPLYEAFAERLHAELDGVAVRVQKSQISFSNRHHFASVWLPVRKVKGRPDVYIVVSFGLDHRVEHPRIAEAVEPYPNRWTHHVIVQSPGEIDDQLMAWIREACAFALHK